MIKKWVNTLSKVCILAFVMISFLAVPAKAAESQMNVVTVATVNIQNATIVSQKGNTIKVGFDITNREGAQPNIKYGIDLAVQTPGGQVYLDSKVYDDVISLGENDRVHITAVYTAPGFLSGSYFVIVELNNQEGMPLGISPAGKITLKPATDSVSIMPESCYLTVGTSSEKYTLTQGVDVDPKEDLVAHCDVKSTYRSELTVTPVFVNHLRNSFGPAGNTIKINPIKLPAGKTVSVSLVIPKAPNPQAYDAVLALDDQKGLALSNSIAFHYVIHGESATIQNVVFDKDGYVSGDTAKLSFFWTGSADAFPGSRLGKSQQGSLNIEATMADGSGVQCADKFSGTLDPKVPEETIRFAVNFKCDNPKADISIKDGNGKVLAKSSFAVTTKPIAPKTKSSGAASLWVYISIAAAIVVVIALAGLYLRKRNISRAAVGTMMLLLAGALLLGAHPAKADTFQGKIDVLGNGQDVITVTYTANINKSLFLPNEDLFASGTFQDAICSNGSHFTSGQLQATMTATVNGNTQTLFSSQDSGSAVFKVETTPGNYQAKFDTVSSWNNSVKGYATYYIPYTVGGYDAQYIQDTIPSSFAPGQTAHVSVTYRNNGQAAWLTGVKGAADPNTKAGTCDVDLTGDGVLDAPAAIDANDNISCALNYAFSSQSFDLRKQGGSFNQSSDPIPAYKSAAPVTTIWHKGDPTAQKCTRVRVCEPSGGNSTLFDDLSPFFISKAEASIAGGMVCYYDLNCYPAPIAGKYTTVNGAVDIMSGESVTFYFDITAPQQEGTYNESWSMESYGIAFGQKFTKTITVGVPKGPAMTVSPANASIKIGDSQAYKATYIDQNGVSSDVTNDPGTTWTSSNNAIAQSTGGGTFKGLAQGPVNVTAAYNSVSASAGLNIDVVQQPVLNVTPSSASVGVGQTVSYKALYTDAMGVVSDVTSDPGTSWTSADPATAKSNGQGVFQGMALGAVAVSATYNSQNGSATLNVGSGNGGGCGNNCPACTLTVSPQNETTTQGSWIDFQVSLGGVNGYNSSTQITFNPSAGITMGPSTPSMMNPGQTANVKAYVGNIQSNAPSVTVTAICSSGGVNLTPSGSIILDVATSTGGRVEIPPR